MLDEWIALQASGQGKRPTQADVVRVARLRSKDFPIGLVIVADGIGTQTGAADAAYCTARKAEHIVGSYFIHHRNKRALLASDAPSVASHFNRCIRVPGIDEPASTLALGLVDGDRVVALWAGDSRVYALDHAGRLQQLTTDHHNATGELTNFLLSDGSPVRTISHTYWNQGPLLGVFACSDGVHARCEQSELAQFLRWCIRQSLRSSSRFLCELQGFLGNNISDNYSAVLLFSVHAVARLRSLREAESALLEEKHADSRDIS